MIEEILKTLMQLGPVVTILVAVIFYLNKKLTKKEEICEEEIDRLHSELRETEKENLTAMYKILAFVEKIDGKDKSRSDILLKELQETRKSIEDKLNDLNK